MICGLSGIQPNHQLLPLEACLQRSAPVQFARPDKAELVIGFVVV